MTTKTVDSTARSVIKPRSHPIMKHRTIKVGEQELVATPVFETYWKFACMRQTIFHRRVRGDRPPWTADPVLTQHRFTNAYRASDRVSQYLISKVIYDDERDLEDTILRILVFKIFNRIDTWEHIESCVGPISLKTFQHEEVENILDDLMKSGRRVYSAAYIMPSPKLGAVRKHANHLRLISKMMTEGFATDVKNAKGLDELYHQLLSWPSFGPFLAFQLAIDINYSSAVDFSEMDFVVAGPGALSGIQKCFSSTGGLSAEEVIRAVASMAPEEFKRLDLDFPDLWGRPLQLIDCQNLFCEVDKYSRVVHPEHTGAGRSRIKQKYTPSFKAVPQWYPPKWGISVPAAEPKDRNNSPQLTFFGSDGICVSHHDGPHIENLQGALFHDLQGPIDHGPPDPAPPLLQ